MATPGLAVGLLLTGVAVGVTLVGSAIVMHAREPVIAVNGVTSTGVAEPDAINQAYVEAFVRRWIDLGWNNNAYNIEWKSVEQLEFFEGAWRERMRASYVRTSDLHATLSRTWKVRDVQVKIEPDGNAWRASYDVRYDQNLASFEPQPWRVSGQMKIERTNNQNAKYALRIAAIRAAEAAPNDQGTIP